MHILSYVPPGFDCQLFKEWRGKAGAPLTRIMSRTKGWMWRRIWNLYDGDRTATVWKGDYDLPANLLDPKAIFAFQLEDDERPFTLFHFIAHMENMRIKLPQRDYDLHKEWVFNTHPDRVPTFKELLVTLVFLLVRCCTRVFL